LPAYFYRNEFFSLENLLEMSDPYLVRGALRNLQGETAILATLEWELTVFPSLPVSVFGIGAGALQGTIFADQGEVDGDRSGPERWTSLGWELRLPVVMGSWSELQLRWGRGYLVQQDRGVTPSEQEYFWSVSLIDPF
jgi:hypothetical protein